MPIRLLNQVFDKMKPGEIYSDGGSTGMGATFDSPAPDPMNPVDQINQQYGYQDHMQSQVNTFDEADRMGAIENATGAQMRIAPRQPVDQQKVDQYNNLNQADKMALDLVNSGKMDPTAFYKIMKEDTRKREEAVMNAMQKLPFDRADMMNKDGQSVETSGGTISDFMKGDASADFRDQTTRQIITSNKTGSGSTKIPTSKLAAKYKSAVTMGMNDSLVNLDEATQKQIKGSIPLYGLAMGIQNQKGGPGIITDDMAEKEASNILMFKGVLEDIISARENPLVRAAGEDDYIKSHISRLPPEYQSSMISALKSGETIDNLALNLNRIIERYNVPTYMVMNEE